MKYKFDSLFSKFALLLVFSKSNLPKPCHTKEDKTLEDRTISLSFA